MVRVTWAGVRCQATLGGAGEACETGAVAGAASCAGGTRFTVMRARGSVWAAAMAAAIKR